MNIEEVMKDAEVAAALYKLAIGEYYVTEETKVVSEDGSVQVITLRKQVPPNVEAQIFWLQNRQPGLWGRAGQVDAETQNSKSAENKPKARKLNPH